MSSLRPAQRGGFLINPRAETLMALIFQRWRARVAHDECRRLHRRRSGWVGVGGRSCVTCHTWSVEQSAHLSPTSGAHLRVGDEQRGAGVMSDSVGELKGFWRRDAAMEA